MMTKEELKEALPRHMQSQATDELVAAINGAVNDPEFAEGMRANILGYSKVLHDGNFRIEDYLNAVVYVSYVLMGKSNQKAYELTHPGRYAALVARGATKKEISAYVAMYNKGKLVNAVRQQAIIPSWLLNQEAYQEAVNTQVNLMRTAKSELVRTQAANSVLTHLKAPEAVKATLDMNINAGVAGLDELKGMLTQLAQQQIDLIESGAATSVIAKQRISQMKDVSPVEP